MSIERPGLYVVATPIGNLGDISPRAVDTLRAVDLVLCEDTRVAGRLCERLGIATPRRAVHEHNETELAASLVAEIKDRRQAYALTCDAGTPLISDPGFRVVGAAHAAELPVHTVPGPSAPIAALSVSGLATDRFCFEGFLPSAGGPRRRRLKALEHETRTMVFLESCHRIAAALSDMVAMFGAARPAAAARELTKLNEEIVPATLGELAVMTADGRLPARGEFVIVVAGGAAADEWTHAAALMRELSPHLPPKTAAKVTAAVTGLRANELYRLAQQGDL